MLHGRQPPSGLGSFWTSFRDASNPVKQVQQSAQWTSDIANKIGFAPGVSVANAFLKATTQVDDEVSRAGKNPALIKIVAVIVAAVLVYFGQVSLAASVIQMGAKYAKGVQVKKDLNKSISEQKKDETAAAFINSLVAYMPEGDQVKIINAYNKDGYVGLNTTEMVNILNTANGIKDISYLASIFSRLESLAKTRPIDYYVHLAISQSVDIKINNATNKNNTLNKVVDYVKNKVNLIPSDILLTLNNQFATYQGDAFSQAGVKTALMPIVQGAVAIIKTDNTTNAPYTPPKQTVFPMGALVTTKTATTTTTQKAGAPITIPVTSSLPASTTPTATTKLTPLETLKKYLPLITLAGIVLKVM